MKGGVVSLPGNVSSQYVSALLMIGPLTEKGLTLRLSGEVVSRPYIDMTLREMYVAGAKAGWNGEQEICVEPLSYSQGHAQFIERDWTAASYWYEVLALSEKEGATLLLHGLLDGSTQGDRRVAEIFSHLGVRTTFRQDDLETVELTRAGQADERLEWDFVETPDLAQTVVVTCCMLGIPFHFTGLQSLKIKETDRIVALQTELRKLGFEVEGNEREMWWEGTPQSIPTSTEAVAIDTYKDHRMAMAFAPCALKLGKIRVNDPMVVTKSYPAYWEQLKKCGFDIEETV